MNKDHLYNTLKHNRFRLTKCTAHYTWHTECFSRGPNYKVKENIFNVVTGRVQESATCNSQYTCSETSWLEFASFKLYCSRWTTENRKQAIKIVPSIRRPGTNSDQNYVSKLDIPGQCWRNNWGPTVARLSNEECGSLRRTWLVRAPPPTYNVFRLWIEYGLYSAPRIVPSDWDRINLAPWFSFICIEYYHRLRKTDAELLRVCYAIFT